MAPIKLIVGLGNPGRRYDKTRHNIGFKIVSFLAEQEQISISQEGFSSLWGKGVIQGVKVIFLLPQTFMNLSGRAVREVKEFYQLTEKEMIVAHDDLDLVLGRVKVDFNASAAGHRGVTSIIEELGLKLFYRLRLGIGRPILKQEIEDYVLSPFSKEERETVQRMTKEGIQRIQQWIVEEVP